MSTFVFYSPKVKPEKERLMGICEKLTSGSPRSRPDSATPGREAGSFFRPRYLPWAKLIARVFESEVLVCPACGGEAKVIAAALP